MFKAALLALVIVVIGSEVQFQVQKGHSVKKVLAVQIDRTSQRQKLTELQAYWQQIIIDSPAYRDGYVQLAYLEKELGNYEKANELWTKVYSLDPNFRPEPLR